MIEADEWTTRARSYNLSLMRRTVRLLVASATIALLGVGCGTTVPLSQRGNGAVGVQSSGAGSSGLETGGAAGSAATSGGDLGSASGSGGAATGGTSGATGTGSGGASGSSGGAGAVGGGGSAGGPTSGSSGGSSGPGVTPTTVYIGASYPNSDVAAGDAALGAANASPGNVQAEYDAVVGYINSHGGVAHRKLSPVWYEQSVQNSASETEQQACATYTQDHKTLIFGTLTPSIDQLMDECAAREGAVILYTGAIARLTSALKQTYPFDVDETEPTIDGSMKITIAGLAKQGYFSTGAKIGIVTWDDPQYVYGINTAAEPALAAIGLHNVPVEYVTSPQSYGDLGATSASAGNAVLKFHAEGIDHVIMFDGPSGVNSSGILVLEYFQQANSQHYFPKYGLNSTSGFTGLASDYPPQEMVGSVGVSWEPVGDESNADYPSSRLPPVGQLCLKIMASAGQQVSPGSNAEDIQLAICDNLFFIQEALDKVSGPLTQQTTLAAINSMGSSFQPAETFGIDVTAQRHAALELVANIAFVQSCTCYRYTSSPYNPG